MLGSFKTTARSNSFHCDRLEKAVCKSKAFPCRKPVRMGIQERQILTSGKRISAQFLCVGERSEDSAG